jgi:hypothetical protein
MPWVEMGCKGILEVRGLFSRIPAIAGSARLKKIDSVQEEPV